MSRSSLHSSIDRRINADQWFRDLSHDAQLVWFRLLCGSHVTPIAGLWVAREEGLAAEFGFSLKQFRELFAELANKPASNGLSRVVADWKAGVLWLPNAINQECNQPSNWKALLGWLKYLEMVPACVVKNRALVVFADWFTDPGNRIRYGIEKGMPNPELDRMADRWRNGMRYSPHARDHAETGSGSGSGTKQDQERPPDPDDRETICPIGIVDRVRGAGVFSELSKALKQPETSLIAESERFAAYWTIGEGMGRKRRNWPGKLRQWLVDKSSSGSLKKPESDVIIWDDAAGRPA